MDEPEGTNMMNSRNTVLARRTPLTDRSDHFAAPLHSLKSGRLRFTNGAHQVVIRADLYKQALYHARFGDRMPTIWALGNVVTIQSPRFPACDWLDSPSEHPAEVELNARVPWDLTIRGGASRFVADLRGLRLRSFRLRGGASRLEVTLPAPSGTVAVVVLGGASNVAIRRPEGVAARLRVDGGATNLEFGDRRVGAAGGELDLRDGRYDVATDRYDMVVTGGANNLSIDKLQRRKKGANLDREGK